MSIGLVEHSLNGALDYVYRNVSLLSKNRSPEQQILDDETNCLHFTSVGLETYLNLILN